MSFRSVCPVRGRAYSDQRLSLPPTLDQRPGIGPKRWRFPSYAIDTSQGKLWKEAAHERARSFASRLYGAPGADHCGRDGVPSQVQPSDDRIETQTGPLTATHPFAGGGDLPPALFAELKAMSAGRWTVSQTPTSSSPVSERIRLMATEPRSALRYRPITGWLDPRNRPVVERRSRQVNTHADAQSTRRSRASLADVEESETREDEDNPRRSQPAIRSGRSIQRTPRADVRETRPGDCDEENLPRTRVPRRDPMPRVSALSRRPQAPTLRTRTRGWLLWVAALAILIVAFLGYAWAWHVHIQGAQDAVSSRFGTHAPADTLVQGDQVVIARNNGDAITVFFIPVHGGQGNTLVRPLSGREWGTPALVIPTLSFKGQVLYLQLVGVPTFPNWAQPEATYRLQNTAEGYQAVQVA